MIEHRQIIEKLRCLHAKGNNTHIQVVLKIILWLFQTVNFIFTFCYTSCFTVSWEEATTFLLDISQVGCVTNRTLFSLTSLPTPSSSNSSEEESLAVNDTLENALQGDKIWVFLNTDVSPATLLLGDGYGDPSLVSLQYFTGELCDKLSHSILRLLFGCIEAGLPRH